jgi:hypothetical protein
MRPQLFACENDHNAVEQLDARLKGRVEVVPCMVDRICSGREIVKGAIKVGTPTVHIVLRTPRCSLLHYLARAATLGPVRWSDKVGSSAPSWGPVRLIVFGWVGLPR